MAFASTDFIFDGVVGSTYGLYLMEIGSSSTDEVSLGGSYEIITDRTNLSPRYNFGIIEDSTLEFGLSIMSTEPIDRNLNSVISRWLFNQRQFKKLKILDDTVQGTYYLCKLNNAQLIKIGNQIYGYKCKVVCDCGYSYENPKKIVRTKSTTPLVIPINNTSDNVDIVYPKIKLYPNKANGVASITNSVDGSVCNIINLVQGEVITMDSKYKIIESDMVDLNFDRFNGVFVELHPRVNKLTIDGDISKIEIEYQFLRSVGG